MLNFALTYNHRAQQLRRSLLCKARNYSMKPAGSGAMISTSAAQPSSATLKTTIRNAGPPFHAKNADVILRSADNVDFRAHRVILSIASPIFSAVFSQAVATNNDAQIREKLDEKKDGLAIVSMAEDERSLEMLLKFCYPVQQPTYSTVEDVVLGLRLADKFQLEYVQSPKHQLQLLAQREPERAYAIACTFQLRDIAMLAARASLLTRNEDLSLHPEFGAISSFDFIRLRKYHAAVLSAMRYAIMDLKWLAAHTSLNALPFPLNQHLSPGSFRHACGNSSCPPLQTQAFGPWFNCGEGVKVLVKPWLQTYLAAADVAIVRNPNPNIVSSYETLFEAYGEASACPLCKTQARSALPKFAGLLVARLDAITSQARSSEYPNRQGSLTRNAQAQLEFSF